MAAPATESDPAVAMARDAALLALAELGTPNIRLYRWDAVCVTLGRNQDPEATLVAPNQTAWAPRPTGGAAVLHGHDVTLAVAVPLPAISAAKPGVRLVYRHLAGVVIEFLATIGVRSGLAEDRGFAAGGPRFADCFASVTRNDIVGDEGRKVCGCALRITRRAALIQTSIPIARSVVDPSSVIVGGVAVEPARIDEEKLEELLRTSWIPAQGWTSQLP